VTVGHNGINAIRDGRAVWVDGDPLMEAIAAAVWEHCDTSGGHSIVTDDPRNIAAVAAHVARAVSSAGPAPATDRDTLERVARRLAARDWCIDEEGDDDWERRGEKFRADYLEWAREVLTVLPAPDQQAADVERWQRKYNAEHARHVAVVGALVTDRAAVLLWAADQIDAETRQAKADGVLEPDKFRPCRDASAQLRRLAGEAQQDRCPSCDTRASTTTPTAGAGSPSTTAHPAATSFAPAPRGATPARRSRTRHRTARRSTPAGTPRTAPSAARRSTRPSCTRGSAPGPPPPPRPPIPTRTSPSPASPPPSGAA
jgi:hypothetical protein